MTGIEVAVACVFAWAVNKARRVGGRADGEVDFVLDSAMDRVHEVVARRLGQDGELGRLEAEAEAGQEEPSALTRSRVGHALAQAAVEDAAFAADLQAAVEAWEAASVASADPVAGAYGLAAGGGVRVVAEGGSFAAGVANVKGDISLGKPPQPGQARS
ncbi:hypothetical protein ABT119_32695 [Streptomyces sp. NPDC001910]|uniref:hypothetical protein n=1 Tax=Streptomyces sp. NPDC001910 TaxID=3154403 RepID=UPI003320B82C